MALIKILKIPRNAVLDGPSLKDASLIFMETVQNSPLKSICHQFGVEFQAYISQRDGSIIIDPLQTIRLGDQSNIRAIYIL
jgi:hypothetical protein